MGNQSREYLVTALAAIVLFGASAAASAGTASPEDSTAGSGSKVSAYPIMFSTPETGFAFGAAAVLIHRSAHKLSESKPSTVSGIGIYTTKSQIISEVGVDHYFKKPVCNAYASASYVKFPDDLYPMGRNSPDAPEDYSSKTFSLDGGIQKCFGRGFELGLVYEFITSDITEVEEGGLLDSKSIVGSEAGRVSGAGVKVDWDTRDNLFYPASGSYHQLTATFFAEAIGSDYEFNRYNVDLRKYIPLAGPRSPKGHLLALQAYGNFETGSPPFQMMSRLGGDIRMRGYYTGRYWDKNIISCQAEYRYPLWWRFGGVLFAGFGDVANEVGDFQLGDSKHSVGWGIRYLLIKEEGMNLRLDVGYGAGTSNMYISVMEAF
jgi:outer membrane protein assembly factor BamA